MSLPNFKSNSPLPPAPPKDLRAHFNLAPSPQGVEQIAGLVRGKESFSMEEITGIIQRDKSVTQRCMLTAFPKAASRDGATLDMAATRLGLSRVISLIVSDLLQQTVVETFTTMVGLELKLDDPATLPVAAGGLLIGSVRFTGRATGDVLLAFPHSLSRFVTALALGANLDERLSPETIHDALGELVNIVTGNLQSRLSDAGLPSEMGLPEVKPQSIFPSVTILGGSSDRFHYVSGPHHLGVNLCISPFSQAPLR